MNDKLQISLLGTQIKHGLPRYIKALLRLWHWPVPRRRYGSHQGLNTNLCDKSIERVVVIIQDLGQPPFRPCLQIGATTCHEEAVDASVDLGNGEMRKGCVTMASKHEFWIRKSKFEPLLQSFYNPKVTIHKHTLI